MPKRILSPRLCSVFPLHAVVSVPHLAGCIGFRARFNLLVFPNPSVPRGPPSLPFPNVESWNGARVPNTQRGPSLALSPSPALSATSLPSDLGTAPSLPLSSHVAPLQLLF